eukprot:CAMPEP_0176493614 /NCGR_PEP_ID=MMETSP0200_2-20121128/9640_1 /TAXON_ID=947934 /ORGANISM="Chaetoceros sp., Strain GSL56" /LENGTH=603 /DNA_ID=CAMNT_0017891283 /DNA_START=1428 /DNA_END=3239 /DNA_ORIENTATION=+
MVPDGTESKLVSKESDHDINNRITDEAVLVVENTVSPKVLYNDRSPTDKLWGIIYVLSYITFLATGFFLVAKSRVRFETDEFGQKKISSFFLEDVQQCCSKSVTKFGLCTYIDDNAGGNRRLAAGNSTFVGDEGIFDAFLDAPHIIIGVFALILAIGVTWVVALRFFAKPIVILAEIAKIVILIIMGVYQVHVSAKVVCWVLAALFVAYDIWARKKLMLAAKIIEYSTVAMKEIPSIFVGSIVIKLLFAGNAALFVYFFTESFDVVEVQSYEYEWNSVVSTDCTFASPNYVRGISSYLCLSYLWTILLFDKMRLSVIATMVGSWHFHPQDKPTLVTSLKNIAPSFGTIAISALISSLAEYINRILNENAWYWWISPTIIVALPIHILSCCFGTCFKTLVQMVTKFALILHVFTGYPFMASAKSAFQILSRHFKGGFVTEVTSKSVLNLGSYAFSIGIAMITWKWIDDEFDCGTLSDLDTGFSMWFILYFIVIMFNLWYPILGIYVIILLNKYLQDDGAASVERGVESMNYMWIPPIAATFVGCIAMLIFQFLSSIFLDIIDTLFLCYAIDKDNNIDVTNDEFTGIVKEVTTFTESESSDEEQN